MGNLGAWLNQSNTEAINASDRATDAWNRILRNPSTLTLVRGQVELASQSMRIEFDNTVSEVSGEGAGKSARRDAVVFGVKDHPTETDTDIQRGDRFSLDGQQYRVVHIIPIRGEIQATVEVLV